MANKESGTKLWHVLSVVVVLAVLVGFAGCTSDSSNDMTNSASENIAGEAIRSLRPVYEAPGSGSSGTDDECVACTSRCMRAVNMCFEICFNTYIDKTANKIRPYMARPGNSAKYTACIKDCESDYSQCYHSCDYPCNN